MSAPVSEPQKFVRYFLLTVVSDEEDTDVSADEPYQREWEMHLEGILPIEVISQGNVEMKLDEIVGFDVNQLSDENLLPVGGRRFERTRISLWDNGHPLARDAQCDVE